MSRRSFVLVLSLAGASGAVAGALALMPHSDNDDGQHTDLTVCEGLDSGVVDHADAPVERHAKKRSSKLLMGLLGTKGVRIASGALGSRGRVGPPAHMDRPARPRWSVSGTEQFHDYGVNAPTLTKVDQLSTFSIDVDTASYTLARSSLHSGKLPPASSVRVEEFVNYFDYDYPGPTNTAPFALNMEAAPSPWQAGHHVLRIGVQGARLDPTNRKPARLVFLVDVSGSMGGPDRLDLARQSLVWLVDHLGPEDSVGLVTYAGSVQRVLEPTPVTEAARIKSAISGLFAGGSTAMGSGIEQAYDMAAQAFVEGAENRVVVISDGDANVGATSHEQILASIHDQARRGITLSTIGVGRGNYKDTMMEQLADQGDGNYYYVDSLTEGKRVFGQRLTGTIQTIAKDVKIQVDFNPELVIAYRLLGYENRDIADRDFRNDAVDAGEIGSGHSVTALYDLILHDPSPHLSGLDLATVRLRAKTPAADTPAREWLTTFPVRQVRLELADASSGFRLSLGAATFAEMLRGSPAAEELTYAQLWELVAKARRPDRAEDTELLGLIETAARLTGKSDLLANH